MVLGTELRFSCLCSLDDADRAILSPLCDYFIILFLFEIESRDLHVVSTNSITELYPADQLLSLNPIWPLHGRDHVLADSYGFSFPSVSLSCLPLKPGEVKS